MPERNFKSLLILASLNALDSLGAVFFCQRLIFGQLILLLLVSSTAHPSEKDLCESIFATNQPRLSGRKELESSKVNQKFWQTYDQIYRARLRYYLVKSSDKYREAAAKGHPHIPFLARVGFDFSSNVVPALSEVLHQIETEMPPDAAIRPLMAVRILNNEEPKLVINGDVHRMVRTKYATAYLRYGEEPTAMTSLRIKITKKNAFQNYRDFAQFMANGYFPISMPESANGQIRGNGISALQHDLAHLDVLREYPEFAAFAKKHYARALVENKTAKDDVKYQAREFLAFESSFIVGQRDLTRLEVMMKLPDGSLSRPDYISELRKYLASQSGERLREIANSINENEYRLLVPIGGSLRDVISPFEFSSLYQFPSKLALSNLRRSFENENAFSHVVKIEALTRFLVFLVEFQKLKPEHWIQAIIVTPGHTSYLKSIVNRFDQIYPEANETQIFRDHFE